MAGIPSATELQAFFDDSPVAPQLFPNQPIQSLGAQVSWGFSNLSPASYLYIYREENLEWNLWNAISGAVYTISGLQIGTDGALHELQFVRTPTSDRVLNTYTFPLDEGFLLGLTVRVSSGAVTRGSAYTQVSLVRGSGVTLLPLHTLLADNVATLSRLGWPGSPIRQSIEGPGTIRFVIGTQPAAGAELSETVPAGARWRVLGWRSALTTSATASDRRPTARARSGANAICRWNAPVVQPASYVSTYMWGAGGWGNTPVFAFSSEWAMNEVILLAGQILDTLTTNIQSGDQWAAPAMLVEEWIET